MTHMSREKSLEESKTLEKKLNPLNKEALKTSGDERKTGLKKKSKAEIERIEQEMREEEAAVRPEVEKQFKEALALLHTKIQLARKSEKDFPPRKALGELLEEIPLFAKMEDLAKAMFATALSKGKEFRSPNQATFIQKGIEVLGFHIEIAVLKQGTEKWLQKKERERKEKNPAQKNPGEKTSSKSES